MTRPRYLLALSSLAALAVAFSSASSAHAATLSLSSGQGYAVGQTFPMDVVVSTQNGESINAVSATVSFSPSQLSLVSISKGNSIITVWASDPTFSNSAGTADLEGVILNPGYSGQNGNVVTLNFKVKTAGLATVSFSQSSVLANDGQGTNVLTSAPSKSIYLGAGAPANSTTNDLVPPGAPSAPDIISSTNPDPTRWYASSSPSFSWGVPADVTAVRLQYDASPIATPSIVYSPAVSSKKLPNIPDGIYYLHAQFKNENGWGAIAHFRFNIDTTPPVPFKVVQAHPDNLNDPRPILYFNTTDTGSGISRYDVKVGNLAFQTIDAATVSSNPYTPPAQTPGEKTVVVNAYDQAGNETTASTNIYIGSINPPVIDAHQDEIQQGDFLRIQGHSYPNATVTVIVKASNGDENSDTAPTNADGKFVMTWVRQLDPGTYTFRATVTDDTGATSLPSESHTVVVNLRTAFWIGSLVVNYLSILFLGIIILSGLVGIVMVSYYKIARLRRKVRRTVSDAERTIHRRFEHLQAEMSDHLALLDKAQNKRQLTREEKVIAESFRKCLNVTEKDIDSELDEIKKEVK